MDRNVKLQKFKTKGTKNKLGPCTINGNDFTNGHKWFQSNTLLILNWGVSPQSPPQDSPL